MLQVSAQDEYFAVLSMDRSTVEVYETGESPLPSQPLSTASLQSGHILAMFQGPKISAPRCDFMTSRTCSGAMHETHQCSCPRLVCLISAGMCAEPRKTGTTTAAIGWRTGMMKPDIGCCGLMRVARSLWPICHRQLCLVGLASFLPYIPWTSFQARRFHR